MVVTFSTKKTNDITHWAKVALGMFKQYARRAGIWGGRAVSLFPTPRQALPSDVHNSFHGGM